MAPKSRLLSIFTRDHLRLAELHLKEGKKDKAAEAFAKAGEYQQAAKLAAEIGDEAKAVEHSLMATLGSIPEGYGEATAQQAGELLAVRGHHKEAIPLFELAKAWRQAAESSLKIKQVVRAARSYERGKMWAEAALYFQRAGMEQDTLRMLELEAKRLQQDPRARNDPRTAARLREVDLERAQILARLGRGTEGAALLGTGQATPKTAQLLADAGKYVEAIEAHLEMRNPEAAARLAPKVEDRDRRRLAEIYLRHGLPVEAGHLFAALGFAREAAEAYETGQDWARAASRWEAARDPQRGAQAYLHAHRPRDAARCFAAAGKPQLAAAAYAEAGDHAAAAASYARAGLLLDAARQFLAAGDKVQAARALTQIQPQDASFREGVLLLAPLLVDEGLFADALHRLAQMPVADRPTGAGLAAAAERLYWEGRAHEGLGDTMGARSCYERLATVQPNHRDAPRRLSALSAPAAERTVERGAAHTAARPAGTATVETRREAIPAGESLGAGQLLLGRYQILAELGRGGMGRVYKAHDRELDETVAIKTVLSQPGESRQQEERLLHEVQICRKITHPNVVRVFDLGRFAGGIFITMEFLEGQPLDKLIGSGQEPLPFSRIRDLLVEITTGLQEAHALGVVHRDLKPSNILVTAGRLKILDFGIARMLGSDTRLTQTGFAVGSPQYMSPEQLQGTALDARSDLYSLGVLAFTLVTGREPFQGANATAIALQHLQQAPPDIRRLRSGVPAGWPDLVARLLAKLPAQRFQSAQEVLAALKALAVQAA